MFNYNPVPKCVDFEYTPEEARELASLLGRAMAFMHHGDTCTIFKVGPCTCGSLQVMKDITAFIKKRKMYEKYEHSGQTNRG